jgi:hypothetical protein
MKHSFLRSALILFSTSLICTSSFANTDTAGTPGKLSLQSDQGVKIEATYNTVQEFAPSNKPRSTFFVEDLTFSAKGIASKKAAVRAILVLEETVTNPNFPSPPTEKTFILDLRYDEASNTYTSFFPTYALQLSSGGSLIPVYKVGMERLPLKGFGYGYTSASRMELALVVDGVWQKDPVNGTSNFLLNF